MILQLDKYQGLRLQGGKYVYRSDFHCHNQTPDPVTARQEIKASHEKMQGRAMHQKRVKGEVEATVKRTHKASCKGHKGRLVKASFIISRWRMQVCSWQIQISQFNPSRRFQFDMRAQNNKWTAWLPLSCCLGPMHDSSISS